MSDALKFEQDGAIARLTIDRPDAGNMLTLAMVREVAELVARAGADPATKALVLRGEGDDFCRGRDLGTAPEHGPTTAMEMRSALMAPILGAYAAIKGAKVPVIAVVQGLANGLGCALAAVCDVTIAADDARFALPEMKSDLPPTLAMYAHLDRIPTKSLLWLVYSTGQIDAAQALAHGLVSHVAPAAELDQTVEDFLAQLTARDREAIVTCKSYLRHARQMDSAAASDLAGNLLSVVLSSR
jgi:enoyl-CoA hydratase